MALRDALRSRRGAEVLATGLYKFLYGGNDAERTETVPALPAPTDAGCHVAARHRLRFHAQPKTHIFLKPNVTKRGAEAYGFQLPLPVAAVLGDLCRLS
jgi:hypothetical protein